MRFLGCRRLMTDDFQLTERARQWIAAIRAQYVARPLSGGESQQVERVAEVAGFKFL